MAEEIVTAPTEDELMARVEEDARKMCESLVAAADGGVSQVRMLPALISILREHGLLPEGKLPSFLGG